MAEHMVEDRCIVSCGMLRPEINHLIESGSLAPRKVLFTPPGLHAWPAKLEQHLLKRVTHARRWCPFHRTIVVHGRKCYVNLDEPRVQVDTILQHAGPGVVRVQGEYGYDMLAGFDERQRISEGRQDKILWFTPGWLRHWKLVYQRYFGWDRADANANFPGFYDKIVVLDALGCEEEYMTERPEEILELFDWTGLEVTFESISLRRFKTLLRDALVASAEAEPVA